MALVPAAGRGLRMGGAVPKQFLALGGRPILAQSLHVLQASPVIHEIILAVPQTERQYCLDHFVATGEFGKVTKVVSGGAQRQDSVRHALAEVNEADIILVHDAVRPFLTAEMIRRPASTWPYVSWSSLRPSNSTPIDHMFAPLA